MPQTFRFQTNFFLSLFFSYASETILDEYMKVVNCLWVDWIERRWTEDSRDAHSINLIVFNIYHCSICFVCECMSVGVLILSCFAIFFFIQHIFIIRTINLKFWKASVHERVSWRVSDDERWMEVFIKQYTLNKPYMTNGTEILSFTMTSTSAWTHTKATNSTKTPIKKENSTIRWPKTNEAYKLRSIVDLWNFFTFN